MTKSPLMITLATACLFAAVLSAQTDAKVDFKRDIQPIFQQNCVGCHGPSQQMGGMRLDRRSSAMGIRGGTTIGPGNAEGSQLYLRLSGTKMGQRMPPTGPLSAEQIDLVKKWIDQGAVWPDDASGEKPPYIGDPAALRLIAALRAGDRETFARLLKENPAAAKLRGKGGATVLMNAAIYGDLDSMRQLIDRGADVNAANEAGATALMWAADDAEKTRLLLDHGADPNATSEIQRTPLTIALGYRRSAAVVKLLLDHGAKTDASAYAGRNPFPAAARDEELLRTVIEHGVPISRLSAGLSLAVAEDCRVCVGILVKGGAKVAPSASMTAALASRDGKAVKAVLEMGADPSFAVPTIGFTALMVAVVSESAALEDTKSLLEHGANVNAKTAAGATALDFAERQGDPAVIDLLRKAGAVEGDTVPAPELKPKPARSAHVAVERSLPLLQRNDVAFLRMSGCVTCHNNNLTAMAVAVARQQGLKVDEAIAASQKEKIVAYMEGFREGALQGSVSAGGSHAMAYNLLGLAAENWLADPVTDAMAQYIKNQQRSDGAWTVHEARPPLNSSDIQSTATAMRALQVYGLKSRRAEYDRAEERAANWLVQARPTTNEDRVFQILGLVWAAKPERARALAKELLATQRSDGGWSQTASLASDGFATGQALFALRESGVLKPSDAAYQRGGRFLIDTQLEDGSWHVRSRAVPFQPYFESGFPHGRDQFISAAATSWAVIGLTPLAR
jgi:ankyrin repeat protein/mono/diheme cytochrome c family protein